MHRRLEPFADDLRGEILERRGHIVPLDRPDAPVRNHLSSAIGKTGARTRPTSLSRILGAVR